MRPSHRSQSDIHQDCVCCVYVGERASARVIIFLSTKTQASKRGVTMATAQQWPVLFWPGLLGALSSVAFLCVLHCVRTWPLCMCAVCVYENGAFKYKRSQEFDIALMKNAWRSLQWGADEQFTFYGVQSPRTLFSQWKSKIRSDLTFCPKTPVNGYTGGEMWWDSSVRRSEYRFLRCFWVTHNFSAQWGVWWFRFNPATA